MEALIIWQPWAWAIGAGLKLVENRTWLPNWRRLAVGDQLAIQDSEGRSTARHRRVPRSAAPEVS